MEQLIAKLEVKIDWLTQQLDIAHKEIEKLKGYNDLSIDSSASMDLLHQMADRSPEDQLQLYIEDSLDLLNTASAPEQTATDVVDIQHTSDLLHEHADNSSTTTTTIEQIDYMTIQEPELNGLQQDDQLVNHDTSVPEASDSTAQTATLTPEQKKRQKNQKNNRRLIKMLEDRYPKAFDWNQPKPLKVGIDKDMVLDEDFNSSKQKRALAAYTRSDRYKKCLLSGQPRVDLEGVAVNNEPALPESMMPAAKTTKTPTTGRPARPKPTSNKAAGNKPSPATRHKEKAQQKDKRNQQAKVAKNLPQQDEAYDNLTPEERMKAKLEKLLNKS